MLFGVMGWLIFRIARATGQEGEWWRSRLTGTCYYCWFDTVIYTRWSWLQRIAHAVSPPDVELRKVRKLQLYRPGKSRS